MKKKKLITIGAIMLIVIAGLFVLAQKSCNLYDDLSVLKGENQALKKITEDMEVFNQEFRDEKEEEIAELRGAIDSLNTKISSDEMKLKVKDQVIDDLELEFFTLTDKDEKIVNLQTQVEKWKEKFSLAEVIIADQKKQVMNWKLSYEAQLEISEKWRESHEREQALRKHGEMLYAEAEKRMKGLRFKFKVSKIVIVGGIAGLAYGLLK